MRKNLLVTSLVASSAFLLSTFALADDHWLGNLEAECHEVCCSSQEREVSDA